MPKILETRTGKTTMSKYEPDQKPLIQHSRVGVKSWSVVGWTYRADTWCTECLRDNGNLEDADNEDTDGGPIFATDEFSLQPHCAGCEEEIPYVTVLESQ